MHSLRLQPGRRKMSKAYYEIDGMFYRSEDLDTCYEQKLVFLLDRALEKSSSLEDFLFTIGRWRNESFVRAITRSALMECKERHKGLLLTEISENSQIFYRRTSKKS